VGGRGDGTFMVVGTTYPWRTSIWCSTNIYISGAPRGHAPRICLPPFPEDGPTYLWCMDQWCATDLFHMHGAPQIHAPRMWVPNTPGPGARWGPHMRGAPLVRCATNKVISVAHLFWCATATYLWSTET
jgi:hypothetical protein